MYPGTSVPDRDSEYPISKIEPLKEPEAKSECLSSNVQEVGLVYPRVRVNAFTIEKSV